MKAAAFDYAKPATIEEAVKLKSQHGDGARFLAGGQSLLPALNLRLDRPSLLIDINGLKQLDGIAVEAGVVRIGALTRTAQIGRSELIGLHAPLLARCVEHIAHPAIRTLGTIGGSIALADPAAEWPAACLALDAGFVVIGPAGERTIAARDFFLGLYTTPLLTDELLVRIEVAVAPPGAKAVVLEMTRRRGDFAIAGVMAQALSQAGATWGDVRIALFGVADRPVRIRAIEQALTGKPDVAAAQAALAVGLTAQADLYHAAATKTHLAKVLLARAVAQLIR